MIGADVVIGAGTVVGPHVVVTGRTTLGMRNRIFQFVSIGDVPQDRKYGGEPTTTTIGDDNVFREFVSIHDENHLESPVAMADVSCRMLERCMKDGMDKVFRRDDLVSVEATSGTSWADKA